MLKRTTLTLLTLWACLAGCGESFGARPDQVAAPADVALTSALTAGTAAEARPSPADIARFAPVVLLHPDERFLPLSIDEMVAGATLRDEHGELSGVPNADALAYRRGTLHLQPQGQAGRPLGPQGTVEVPMYVAVQRAADATWEINYLLLFGYQGSQVVRFATGTRQFVAAVTHYGEHIGDLERLMVRVDRQRRHVLEVRFEAHGKGSTFAAPAVTLEGGTHPRVLCALHSHALYNAAVRHPHHAVVQRHYAALGWGIDIVDLLSTAPIRWAPRQPSDFHLLQLAADGRPLGHERWAAYAGALGEPQVNTYGGVRPLPSQPLSNLQHHWAKLLTRAVRAFASPQTLGVGEPPQGPALRPWVLALPG